MLSVDPAACCSSFELLLEEVLRIHSVSSTNRRQSGGFIQEHIAAEGPDIYILVRSSPASGVGCGLIAEGTASFDASRPRAGLFLMRSIPLGHKKTHHRFAAFGCRCHMSKVFCVLLQLASESSFPTQPSCVFGFPKLEPSFSNPSNAYLPLALLQLARAALLLFTHTHTHACHEHAQCTRCSCTCAAAPVCGACPRGCGEVRGRVDWWR